MENENSPAMPCMPIQDTLGRLVAPIPGMTKYELVLKDILCSIVDPNIGYTKDAEQKIIIAAYLTEQYFLHLNKNNESNTTTKIVL